MKQKDIALIIVISFISAVLSFVVSNMLFSSKDARSMESAVVTPITTDFPEPDDRYFNENSVNPTQIIRIGDNTNQQPFNQ